MKTLILSLFAVAAVALIFVPGLARALGEKANDALFGYMVRTGAVLGAEVLGRAATEIAAGRKIDIDSQGKVFTAVCEMPAAWTAANGDTVATGIVIPKGARLVDLPLVSNGTGTASQTLSVGLRDNKTKVATDATGIVNALAITTAAMVSPATGTLMITGQRYVMPADQEIYFTLAGATPTANQPIRVEVGYIPA